MDLDQLPPFAEAASVASASTFFGDSASLPGEATSFLSSFWSPLFGGALD